MIRFYLNVLMGEHKQTQHTHALVSAPPKETAYMSVYEAANKANIY